MGSRWALQDLNHVELTFSPGGLCCGDDGLRDKKKESPGFKDAFKNAVCILFLGFIGSHLVCLYMAKIYYKSTAV